MRVGRDAQQQVAAVCRIRGGEVGVFQRNPQRGKALEHLRPVAPQDARALDIRVDLQQDAQRIARCKRRVQAVGALDDGDGARCAHFARKQRLRMAVVALGEVGPPLGERRKRVGEEALVIDVAAGLGKPLRRALLRLKKVVVHVQRVRVIEPGEQRGERRLAAGARAVDGDDDVRLHPHERVDAA